MRPGAASIHSGEAIGLPHWAQGFSRGKEKNSCPAMAHLPFSFMFEHELDTGSPPDAGAPMHSFMIDQ
jgi:hypothetical protein